MSPFSLPIEVVRYLRDQVQAAGFGPALAEIEAKARECVYIIDDNEHEAEVGASQFGLEADLPASISWPVAGEPPAPGEFLFQLSLKEVPALPEPLLPSEGHLWFFVHQLRRGGYLDCTVLFNAEAKLTRQEPPSLPKMRLVLNYGAHRFTFQKGISLPLGDRAFREQVCLAAGISDWDQLHEALEPKKAIGQIGGYAYNYEGSDILRDTVMTELGENAQTSTELYNSEADIDEALTRTPAELDFIFSQFVSTPTYQEIESLRPTARWLEQHRSQIEAWEFVLRLDTSIADAYPIWVFRKKGDRQRYDFSDLLIKYHR